MGVQRCSLQDCLQAEEGGFAVRVTKGVVIGEELTSQEKHTVLAPNHLRVTSFNFLVP